MPRTYLMNFDAGGKRWRKTYRGVKYEIYLRDLSLDPAQWTEMGSYQAANNWWKGKLAEIQKAHPHARIAELVQPRIAYAERRGMTDEATANKELLAKVLTVPSANLSPLMSKITLGNGTDLASSPVWADRFAREPKEPPPSKANTSIGAALDSWLTIKRVRAKASSVVMLGTYVTQFRKMLDADKPVGSLDEDASERVFHLLDAQSVAPATKRKQWITFKNFVKYAAAKYRFPLPANLDSKEYGWAVPITEKKMPPSAEVLAFVNELPDRLRLYALLAWNCGCNNIDIASLTRGQIDLKAGTLTRRRTKTGEWSSVPKVVYGLWRETARLLAQEMSADGELALGDVKGQPLYVTDKNGSGKLYDKIKSQWRDTLGRSAERPHTLKDFRDFGSIMLQGSPHRSYQQAWLGHSPNTVAGRHYSGTEDVIEACRWMERQIWAEAAL